MFSLNPPPLAVYIHWPFCLAKCPYCDFNSHVRERIDADAWTVAYIEELNYFRMLTGPRRVTSVFFGGGTPSLMRPDDVGKIIRTIDDLWGVSEGVEVTLEANPTSSEIGKFKAFKENGINRLSIGIQALNDTDLKRLGRQHDAAQGIQAIDMAASVFDRYSFDLIYARPGQSVAAWRDELTRALEYARGHLSLYELTIEEGTAFAAQYQRGELKLPVDDVAVDFRTATLDIMAAAGYENYEISNYAQAGHESRHNLTYWRYGDYVGVGPGAHGRITAGGVKLATRTHRAPEAWLNRIQDHGNGLHPIDIIESRSRGVEAVMMGLRLRSGLELAQMEREIGAPIDTLIDAARVQALIQSGDLEATPGRLVPTDAGRMRLNALTRFVCANA